MDSNSYYILENSLPNDFPTDLIRLINKFCCNCCFIECDFCDETWPSCYLRRCMQCKKKSCGMGSCPKFKIDIIITYSDSHKELKCAKKCGFN